MGPNLTGPEGRGAGDLRGESAGRDTRGGCGPDGPGGWACRWQREGTRSGRHWLGQEAGEEAVPGHVQWSSCFQGQESGRNADPGKCWMRGCERGVLRCWRRDESSSPWRGGHSQGYMIKVPRSELHSWRATRLVW